MENEKYIEDKFGDDIEGYLNAYPYPIQNYLKRDMNKLLRKRSDGKCPECNWETEWLFSDHFQTWSCADCFCMNKSIEVNP
jgi:hypothetical protein